MAVADIPFDPRKVLDFFTRIIDAASAPVVARLIDSHIALAGELMLSLGTIALSLLGWAIATGKVQSPVEDFTWFAVKIGILAAMLTTADYTYWVRDAFHTAFPATIGAITSLGGEQASGASAWDALLNQSWAASMEILGTLNRFDPMKLFVVAFLACALAAVVAGYGIWLLGHFMSDIYLTVGPVFLPLILFAATRGIFNAWVGSLAATVVLQLLALVVSSVLIAAEGQILRAVASGSIANPILKLGVMFGAAAIFVLCAFYARRLPAAATALTGGFQWQPTSLVNATMGAIERAPGAIGGAMGQMAKGGYQRAKAHAAGRSTNTPPGPSLSQSGGTPVAT